MTTLWNILASFWAVLAEMAPWLLLGFLAAGVLSVFFKPAWIERHLGGGGVGPVVKASVFGVPLPVCSCGVIPLAAGMYRHGASKGATSSFLLSTPQTGVDSILATWGLMGPVFAIIRPAIALVSGIAGGLLIDRVDRIDRGDRENNPAESSRDTTPTAVDENESCESSCCDTDGAGGAGSSSAPPSFAGKAFAAVRYGLVTLPGDLAWALVVGLTLAAVLTAVVDPEMLAPWLGHPVYGLLTAVVIGTPIYVCSTGSIPIAVGLMLVGASPGAALAFLIAGPATNVATLSVIWNVLGRRSAGVYLGVVLVTALGSGWALNAAVAAGFDTMLPLTATDAHRHALTWIDHGWAALLVVVMAAGVMTRYRVPGRPAATATATADTTQRPGLAIPGSVPATELTITGMRCSHCAASAERALREVAGVCEVRVDLPGNRATVQGNTVDPQALIAAVQALGYDAAVAE